MGIRISKVANLSFFCVPIGLVWLEPGSRRPRARVPLVVWAWDLVVVRLLCCGFSAPAPGLYNTRSVRGRSVHPPSLSLRMAAQLYSLRASATRLTGKHWAAPYASSLLARSRARARCGAEAPAPASAARVPASRVTGYFPVFVVLEFRKSSDENVEMTNIDFVILEFRKSSNLCEIMPLPLRNFSVVSWSLLSYCPPLCDVRLSSVNKCFVSNLTIHHHRVLYANS
jgi:hypothetical protein